MISGIGKSPSKAKNHLKDLSQMSLAVGISMGMALQNLASAYGTMTDLLAAGGCLSSREARISLLRCLYLPLPEEPLGLSFVHQLLRVRRALQGRRLWFPMKRAMR